MIIWCRLPLIMSLLFSANKTAFSGENDREFSTTRRSVIVYVIFGGFVTTIDNWSGECCTDYIMCKEKSVK